VSETEPDGAGETGPKPGSIAYYAREYAADERTVKRWNRKGRDNSDITPLADPESMLGWWSRNMSQRVPDGISAAVVRWRVAHKSNPAAVSRELPLVPAEIQIPSDKLAERRALLDQPIEENAIGPEQTLQRLLELEPRLHRFATDPGQAKDYLATVARIGPAAKILREENERLRKLIPKAEAEAAIQSLHVPIKNETYLLGPTMCAVLGVPLTPAIEEAWRAECDRLFHRLKETVFAA